ncbi:hypothetical protein AAFN60_17320 [Roseibacillus persicicus]|uniref:hypothetical protein n=1 Tax=Roseibacillus persicicus TaxID=454148 RepID=UPI00398B49E0
MSPLRRESKALARQNCLAKEIALLGEGPREARSGDSFLTTLLDNWNTGTLLSPLRLRTWMAKTFCLAGEGFFASSNRGRGVATFQLTREGQVSGLLRHYGFTG